MAESKNYSSGNYDTVCALETGQVRFHLVLDNFGLSELLEANLRKSQSFLWGGLVDVVCIADELKIELGEGQEIESARLKVIC